MGFGPTTNEASTVYRYWWSLAHLHIDPRLVEGITSHEQAARVDDLLQAVTGPPIPVSATLADARQRLAEDNEPPEYAHSEATTDPGRERA